MLRFPCDYPSLTAGIEPYGFETENMRCTESDQFVHFELTR